MPFDFSDFEDECACMSDVQLAAAKQKYTRLASGSMGSALASGLFLGPFVVFSVAAASATSANAGGKLAIINNEMNKPHRTRASTRMRDIVGGFALTASTAGLGHGVGHAANHIISHPTHHALNHTQSMVCSGLDSGAEHGTKHLIEGVAYGLSKICDNCFTGIGDGRYHWHCTDCPDYDLCRTCYKNARECHYSYHNFV
jgi:hypothetical protein